MAHSRKVALTGIKPSGPAIGVDKGGSVHLGNYVGAIRPALRLQDDYECRYFIADYHALTEERQGRRPGELRAKVYDLSATWLACGLDPDRALLFRQSSVGEVFELMWVLACSMPSGQLERGHAYKDALAHGKSPNAGVLNYPLLMAADILLYDAELVPIGLDQKQHLEVAHGLALRLNHRYGEGTVVVPKPLIGEAPVVPGLDGRKMSKSYGNEIPLFASRAALAEAIMKYRSDSTPLEAPKRPEGALVFELYQLFATPEQVRHMAERLRAGGYGWGEAKQELVAVLDAELGPLRERYVKLRADEGALDAVLARGAERARVIARKTMDRVRGALGMAW